MAKGGAFEREMCHTLSEWWNKQDDTFWRTQGSGNRATVRSKAGKRTSGQYGDICAVDSRGRLFTRVCVTSLKRGYQGTTIQDLLDQSWTFGEPIFASWIREAIRDQKSAGVAGWMIITRRNKKEAIVFINDTLHKYLRDTNFKFNPCPQFRVIVPVANKTYNRNHARLRKKSKKKFDRKFKVKNHLIWGFTLKDFMRRFKRKHFKQVLKRIRIHATKSSPTKKL